MQLSPAATTLAFSFLIVCACGSAQERSATSSQRYRVHVPREVKFGTAQPALASQAAALQQAEDVQSLAFVAETTSGVTIQFETQTQASIKPPLKLTVGGSQRANWWAVATQDASGATGEFVAEAPSVQASTLKPGWSTLQLDIATLPSGDDAAVTTVVVTIVAH